MKTEFKVVKTKDFLKTKSSGELNLNETRKVLSKLADLNSDDPVKEILIDIRETESVLSLSDIFTIVNEVGKFRKAFRKKIAVLLGPSHDFDKARFLEMCAGNRGFNVNAFGDFEEAVKWLADTE
ncbi:MAG: hypothetical protein K8I03_03235 [Ignavibacteria bacterium]|nr:hypothetical protein [Ignavibacteria bacterium]